MLGGCRSPQPITPSLVPCSFGIALYSLRRFAEAAQAFKRMPLPTSWSRARLAACYAQLGRTAEAQAAVAEVLRLQPDFSTAEFMRKSVLLERRRGPGASPRRARQGRIAGMTWFARPQQVLSSSLASFCRPA